MPRIWTSTERAVSAAAAGVAAASAVSTQAASASGRDRMWFPLGGSLRPLPEPRGRNPRGLSPCALRQLGDGVQLALLGGLADVVADRDRGEPALGRDGQMVVRVEARRLGDPRVELVGRLQLVVLGG